MKKILNLTLIVAMSISLVACGGNKKANDQGSDGKNKKEDVVLTVMHARPDPSDALHQYYQDVQTRFETKYPNVKVEYEIYDNETYKKKLQIYGSSKSLPDVFYVWSNPSEFMPYVNAGLAAELAPADFTDYNFLPGAMEGATVDGKLLGLPLGIDYWYLYVNNKIFKDNGIKVPTTIEELETAVNQLNEAGIAPISMNGKDLWNQLVLLNDVMFRYTKGNAQPIIDAAEQKTKFAETPEFVDAAKKLKELVNIGLFQNSWTIDDDATGKNLFIQGKAAMWYTGTWNNAIATDENIPAEVRENLSIIPFPSLDGTDTSKNLMGREGTTMMIAENSLLKEEAVNYLKEFFDPEYYPKASWENGIGIPMQKFDQFVKDSDAPLLKEVAQSISSAESVASHPYAFRLNPVFEQDCKDLIMQYLLNDISIEKFWEETDEAASLNQVN